MLSGPFGPKTGLRAPACRAWALLILASVGTFLVLSSTSSRAVVREQASTKPKAAGLNYGNRFIPEAWMGPSANKDHIIPHGFFRNMSGAELVLADVVDMEGLPARTRMMGWLDENIKEEHFATMQRNGVNVVRVPTGYWNWITEVPDVPADFNGFPTRQKCRNLQQLGTPEDYLPYFDKIFTYARKHNVQVWLDLHSLPGGVSQGETAGIVFGDKDFMNPYFFGYSERNMKLAVKAVGIMAKYVARQGSTLYGLQIINEPAVALQGADYHVSKPFALNTTMFAYMTKYYQLGIQEARKYLSPEKTIILFEWPHLMFVWPDNAFPTHVAGDVIWDTHIYQFPKFRALKKLTDNYNPENAVTKALTVENITQYWEPDIEIARSFQKRGNPTVVGEWSLGLIPTTFTTEQQQYLALWFIDKCAENTHGSLYWNYDMVLGAPYPAPLWSFVELQGTVLDWKAAFTNANGPACTPHSADSVEPC